MRRTLAGENIKTSEAIFGDWFSHIHSLSPMPFNQQQKAKLVKTKVKKKLNNEQSKGKGGRRGFWKRRNGKG